MIYLILAIIGICIGLYKFSSGARNKWLSMRAMNKAKADQNYAQNICNDIHTLYKSESVIQFDLLKAENVIKNFIDNIFGIVDCARANQQILMLVKFVTEELGTTGKLVTYTHYQFFVLSFDNQSKKINILGNLYNTNEEKAMRQNFAIKLMQKLTI